MENNTVNVNNFNAFLSKANEVLSCNAECQKQKKLETLEQKYLDAKTNLVTAPNQVQSTYKNFLIYSQGDEVYNEYIDTTLEKKAELIIDSFKSNFYDALDHAKTLFETYNGLLLNFMHVVELHTKLVKENAELSLMVKNKSSDVLTNDRKTYYEDQSIDSLTFFYIIFLIVYVIIVLAFAAFIFVFPSATPRKKQIFILIFLIIYPFISTKIFIYLIKIYNTIVSVLPHNVYKNI
jgi:hypothetical protein